MTQETFKIIKTVIDYIEVNLKDSITLDDISQEAGISKYHLHRIFKSITGSPLMEYFIGRKLSESTNELINTELKIIDIAHEYGFEYEQNYIRSFKNQFSVSPSKFRKEKKAIKIIDRIDLTRTNSIKDRIIIEPQIVIRPPIYIVGQTHKLYTGDNCYGYTASKVASDFYYNHKHNIRNAKGGEYIGLTRYIDKEYSYYQPSIEVDNYKKIPHSMTKDTIVGNKYAVFKYIDLCNISEVTIGNIIDVYDYVFNTWLYRSGYEQSHSFHYESIREENLRSDYCEVDIFVPIKRCI
ncbi:AraC family transcriptional regulator [Clostridium sp. YIM B02505]|uniref:AraC family transcriptional regulator n=1 Tax=Clostridium yunnanense TaxID=2800325 RepID=A0ABS1EN40_9CLOT|nr:helix-turn-helix domain-containing protein [Clostridium yunnanense]MBK1810688.1 AraC family transcriptional regulator [Clostridium yunnanense]